MERKKRVVPREVCAGSLERSKQCREALLSMQKSVEVIVAEM